MADVSADKGTGEDDSMRFSALFFAKALSDREAPADDRCCKHPLCEYRTSSGAPSACSVVVFFLHLDAQASDIVAYLSYHSSVTPNPTAVYTETSNAENVTVGIWY